MACSTCGLSTSDLRPVEAAAFFRGLWRRYADLLARIQEDDLGIGELARDSSAQSLEAIQELGVALGRPVADVGGSPVRRIEVAGDQVARRIESFRLADYGSPLASGADPLTAIRGAVHAAAHPLRIAVREADRRAADPGEGQDADR